MSKVSNFLFPVKKVCEFFINENDEAEFKWADPTYNKLKNLLYVVTVNGVIQYIGVTEMTMQSRWVCKNVAYHQTKPQIEIELNNNNLVEIHVVTQQEIEKHLLTLPMNQVLKFASHVKGLEGVLIKDYNLVEKGWNKRG